MRDHVTEERISAYVDGELEGDELKLVETLLAESAEHRQLLAELQDLRASLQALPSFNLPADFHARVVAQIEQAAVTPSPEPVLSRRESKSGPWRSVLVAVASLAALVAFTVMLRPPTSTPVDDGSTTIGTTPVTMPVYLRQEPVMVMVYDVTVTPAGQKRKVIDRLLQNLGIGIDPALRLDSDLEKSFTAYRSPPGLEDQAQATPFKDPTAQRVADENVEIIYVASLVNVLDQFYLDLFRMQEAGDEVTRLRTDLVFEPNKLGVMHRLHESAREHFAHRSNVPPSDRGEA
ncbi:MAG: hypothetical protein HYV60_06135, partial [Planctomycetia bacterium]|nr:hypothetical protein [Planctomycetia bacterium]